VHFVSTLQPYFSTLPLLLLHPSHVFQLPHTPFYSHLNFKIPSSHPYNQPSRPSITTNLLSLSLHHSNTTHNLQFTNPLLLAQFNPQPSTKVTTSSSKLHKLITMKPVLLFIFTITETHFTNINSSPANQGEQTQITSSLNPQSITDANDAAGPLPIRARARNLELAPPTPTAAAASQTRSDSLSHRSSSALQRCHQFKNPSFNPQLELSINYKNPSPHLLCPPFTNSSLDRAVSQPRTQPPSLLQIEASP
jgi:hypothetical protein